LLLPLDACLPRLAASQRPRHQAPRPPLRSSLRRGPTRRGGRARRPWEAPEALLADAGVELGVNYPLPLVTPAESRAALARAAAVIDQAMAWPAGGKAPYRPASVPSQRPSAATPTASSVPQDDAERGAPPARGANAVASDSGVHYAPEPSAGTAPAAPLARALPRARRGRLVRRAAAAGAARAPKPRGAPVDVDGLAAATAEVAAASGIVGGGGDGSDGDDGGSGVVGDSGAEDSEEEAGSIGSNVLAAPPARRRRRRAPMPPPEPGSPAGPHPGPDASGTAAPARLAESARCSGASARAETRDGGSCGDQSRRVPVVNGVALARRAAGAPAPAAPPPALEVPCLSCGGGGGARVPEAHGEAARGDGAGVGGGGARYLGAPAPKRLRAP